MKAFALFGLFLALPFWLTAQQKPQHSQYMINNYLLNPAISGIEDYAEVKLSSRQQWWGIEGAPVTFYLSAHLPLGPTAAPGTFGKENTKPTSFGQTPGQYGRYRRVKPHHGLGATLLHDRIGPFARTEGSVSYAYHLALTERVKLATGLNVGLIRQALRPTGLTFGTPVDNAAAGWALTRPNLGVGVWLYGSNFYLGAAGGQLFTNAIRLRRREFNPAYLPNHYFLTGAYKFSVGPDVAVIPSVLVKYTAPLPVSVDYNVRLVFADRVWAGASFRPRDSFIFLAGVTLHHALDISYAYDAGVSSLGGASAGSHELVLGLRLFNRQKVLCPQNLW